MTSSARPVAAHSTNSFPSDKDKDTGSALYMYATVPPSISELIGSTHDFHIPDKVYRGAFYSKEYDAPGKREYAGLQYQLKSGEGLSVLEDWNDGGGRESIASRSDGGTKGKANIQRWSVTSSGWEYAGFPPNPRNVRKWLLCNAAPCPTDKRKSRSQVRLSLRLALAVQPNNFIRSKVPHKSTLPVSRILSLLRRQMPIGNDRACPSLHLKHWVIMSPASRLS